MRREIHTARGLFQRKNTQRHAGRLYIRLHRIIRFVSHKSTYKLDALTTLFGRAVRCGRKMYSTPPTCLCSGRVRRNRRGLMNATFFGAKISKRVGVGLVAQGGSDTLSLYDLMIMAVRTVYLTPCRSVGTPRLYQDFQEGGEPTQNFPDGGCSSRGGTNPRTLAFTCTFTSSQCVPPGHLRRSKTKSKRKRPAKRDGTLCSSTESFSQQ